MAELPWVLQWDGPEDGYDYYVQTAMGTRNWGLGSLREATAFKDREAAYEALQIVRLATHSMLARQLTRDELRTIVAHAIRAERQT